jgi:hypothetical protein
MMTRSAVKDASKIAGRSQEGPSAVELATPDRARFATTAKAVRAAHVLTTAAATMRQRRPVIPSQLS